MAISKFAKDLEASNGWSFVEHNLSTFDIIVEVYGKDNRHKIPSSVYQLEIKDENNIVIIFGSPIEANKYRAVVIG